MDEVSYRLPRFAAPSRYQLELEPDLTRDTFGGRVAIDLEILEPTDHLVLNAVDMEIRAARLTAPGGRALDGSVEMDEAEQQLTIRVGEECTAGTGYRLVIEFNGQLNSQLHGFYRSTFHDEDGNEQVIATTQFEPSDARRAFPCWDEPDFKATFQITLVVEGDCTAVSNAAEESIDELPDGRKRIVFGETMKMSTYLVAFVVGPYELTGSSEVDGVPLRIVAVPGKAHLASYAERVASHAVAFLSRYFDIPYPGSKLDHIAVPDFAFGAMENLGCVTYRENLLLADPDLASQLELQRIATVIAHETAHMWFGDLVTMKWWNGIWLNEAFATFMENTVTDDFNPDWQVWTAFGAGKSHALVTDGLEATRPVEYGVGRPEEAEAMFDVLTYQKGGSVLRMLEQYIGPERFRKGISHYLRTHAYTNTETEDLWAALETISGAPVRSIMDSWILRAGHPILTVSLTDDPSVISIRQERFSYAGAKDGPPWGVPITLRASAGGAVQRHRILADGTESTFAFDAPLDWVVVNDGSWGFYRVRYEPDLWQRMKGAGVTKLLDPLERLSLVSDSWATVVAGRTNLAEWAEVAVAASEEADPDVWGAIVGPLAHLKVMATESDSDALDRFILQIAEPVWSDLGWDPSSAETTRIATARARLLGALSLVSADTEIKAEAARRFSEFLAGNLHLTPDLVGVTARITVASGGRLEWDAVLDRYRSANLPQDRQRYLFALAATDDLELLGRTLDLSLSSEVRTQDAPFLVASVLAQRTPASRLGWEWVMANWSEIYSRFPSSLLIRMLEGLANVVDGDLAASAEDFCRRPEVQVTGPRLEQLLERVRLSVALGSRISGTFGAALKIPE